ncbi:uncharacterized protein LOC113293469 [Papaver somniferum]|uniref:uncharacterized protein LOC113293469 n=1 Tax=Papaver somniferum TaxID=3469 RepID=UPI000E704551|nr:uncharacterized protein LOC113293469 [Papaver somniferum]
MFSRVTNIPTESLILPVISTNDRLTLGCELWHLCLGWNHNTWATTNIASIGSIQPVDKAPPFQHWLQEQREYSTCQVREETCYTRYCLALGRSFSQGLVLTPKVFLLNGSHDRETSGLSISGFITAIADALNRTFRDPQNCMKNPQVGMLLPCWFPRMVKFQ